MSSSRRGSLTSMSSRSRTGTVVSAGGKQKQESDNDGDKTKKLSSDTAAEESIDRGMKSNKKNNLPLPKKASLSSKAAASSAVSTKRTRSTATVECMIESEDRSENNATDKEVLKKKQKRDDTVAVAAIKKENDGEELDETETNVVKKKKKSNNDTKKSLDNADAKVNNKKKSSSTNLEHVEVRSVAVKNEACEDEDKKGLPSSTKSKSKSKVPAVAKNENAAEPVSTNTKVTGKNKKQASAISKDAGKEKTENSKKTVNKVKSEQKNKPKSEKLKKVEEKNGTVNTVETTVRSPAREGSVSLSKDESHKKVKATKDKSIKAQSTNMMVDDSEPESKSTLAVKQEFKEATETASYSGKIASLPAIPDANSAGVSSLTTSKAAKKKSKKQDAGKPSRPLSAYNLFFKDTRLILLEEQKNKAAEPPQKAPKESTPDKEGDQPPVRRFRALEEMVKEIGKRWKEFDPEKKAEYRARAEAETKRYTEQMLQYRKEQKTAIAIAKAELKKEKALASKQLKKGSKKAAAPSLHDDAGTLDSDDQTKKRKTTKNNVSSKEKPAPSVSLQGTVPQGQSAASLRGNLGQGDLFNQVNEQQFLQLQLQQQQRMMLEQRELQELMMKQRIQEHLLLLQRQQLLSGRGLNDASSMLGGSAAFNHQMASHGIVSGDIDVSTLSDAELHLLVERRRLQQSMAYEQSLLGDNFGAGLLMGNNSQQGMKNGNGASSNGRQSMDGMSGAESNVADMQRLLMNQKLQQLQSGSVQNASQQDHMNDVLGSNYNSLSLSSETDFAQQRELQLRRRLMMANMASQQMYTGTPSTGVSSGGSASAAGTPSNNGVENTDLTNNAMNPPASAGAGNTGISGGGNTELSPFMSSGAGAHGTDDQEFRRPSIVSLSTDEGAAGNMMNMYNNANHNEAIRRLLFAQQQQELMRKQQLMELYSPNPVNYP